jgi:hypothetical protein
MTEEKDRFFGVPGWDPNTKETNVIGERDPVTGKITYTKPPRTKMQPPPGYYDPEDGETGPPLPEEEEVEDPDMAELRKVAEELGWGEEQAKADAVAAAEARIDALKARLGMKGK